MQLNRALYKGDTTLENTLIISFVKCGEYLTYRVFWVTNLWVFWLTPLQSDLIISLIEISDQLHCSLRGWSEYIGVPQTSVLCPLLFLIYLNDINVSINFADDTNLLITRISLKSIIKQTNIYLKLLCNLLKANKISLNSSKTEAILYRHPNKKY